MIHILIDDRERNSPVPEAIAATEAFTVEFSRLKLGDYVLDDALVFERKSLLRVRSNPEKYENPAKSRGFLLLAVQGGSAKIRRKNIGRIYPP